MFVTAANPTGAITSLNLAQIPIWKLQLAGVGNYIGIALMYVSAGTTAQALLAGLDTGVPAENTSIANTGFPRWDKAPNLDRLQESMKILHNSDIRGAQVDELIAKSAGLVNIYHEVRDALFMKTQASGIFEDWRWVVSPEFGVTKWPTP